MQSIRFMKTLQIPTSYYQQFDADANRDVPAEGYSGWKQAGIELSLDHTAVVVMHAWDCGTREQYPGWHRAVEYIPRADEICRTVFPKLPSAVRASELRIFHMVGGGNYYREYAGYQMAVRLAGAAPEPLEQVETNTVLDCLKQFRAAHTFVGTHNAADVKRGTQHIDFSPNTEPLGNEGIAENSHQLFTLCKHTGVNHLIYAGFAIN